jgi:CheY-like chemotaxis protein
MTNKKTLIVEDVEAVLSNMEIAFRIKIFEEPTPIKLSKDPANKLKELGIDIAKTYREAEQCIESEEYDYVLLDHNLPYETGQEAEDIGYNLIPKIRQRNPETKIIGTSSNQDVNQDGLDYRLKKYDFDFMDKLEEIYME